MSVCEGEEILVWINETHFTRLIYVNLNIVSLFVNHLLEGVVSENYHNYVASLNRIRAASVISQLNIIGSWGLTSHEDITTFIKKPNLIELNPTITSIVAPKRCHQRRKAFFLLVASKQLEKISKIILPLKERESKNNIDKIFLCSLAKYHD